MGGWTERGGYMVARDLKWGRVGGGAFYRDGCGEEWGCGLDLKEGEGRNSIGLVERL